MSDREQAGQIDRQEPSHAEDVLAHVIVCGNEKGGAGKTTTAINLVVALLQRGASVATIDLDGQQQSFTRYIDNREAWRQESGARLPMPLHFCIEPAVEVDSAKEREEVEFQRLAVRLSELESGVDFVVIDTPGFHSYLTRLAHSLADTLVTPINESFVDLDVFGKFRGEQLMLEEIGPYGEMVTASREQRRTLDGGRIDWVVVRNRLAQIASHNHQNVLAGLEFLSNELDFRLAAGIGERNIFREFFPMGLTAMDEFSIETLGSPPTMSHLAARREVRALVKRLNLPAPKRLQTQNAPVMQTDAFEDIVEAGRVLREEALHN
ncbi:MAG: division plane positioning ATPase MipZ [Pseudomonadota bacterium]